MKARELRLGHSKQIRKYARSKVSGPLQSQVSSKRSSRGKDTTLALKAKIRRLEAQVETISSGQTHSAQTTSQIHRPSKGSAGDGFNLQVEMGLEDDDRLYKSIRSKLTVSLCNQHKRTIRTIANGSHLDWCLPWYRQDKTKIGRIMLLARKRQPYLERFARDWATEEFLKSHLKNKRHYNKRMGYDDEMPDSPEEPEENLPFIDEGEIDMAEEGDDHERDEVEHESARRDSEEDL
ncbi:hypothetical protein IEO21_10457 [Rhodonia placenta]|uniref:Uncharacterized protein n=1 Tax=Rhodonia placenta TaxID=104341 RepID=A0A8H7NSI8_9APHY|nr:hypothetical protein IEO21_10457 [Postia placenta]